MIKKIEVHILRAFVNKEGKYGNPTGIVLDLHKNLLSSQRQKIATQLHFTDTVFINNLNDVDVSFYNPQQETKFAGDALISTSYFLKHHFEKKNAVIGCKVGEVSTWTEGELTWIESSITGTAAWIHKQVKSIAEVNNITPEEAAQIKHTMVWAWEDESKSLIRSRTFLPDWGTLEDQGNGSGAMQLAKMLGRNIEINQGHGSIIFAQPSDNTNAKVGGRVHIDAPKIVILE